MSSDDQARNAGVQTGRRDFLTRSASTAVGAALGVAAGDPQRRGSSDLYFGNNLDRG